MAAHEYDVGNVSEAAPTEEEQALVESLRRRDEAAFVTLIERYQTPLLRLAMAFVSDRAAAEDVVQETWLGVVRGIDRFEGRSSLRTWLFRILTNRARTRGAREGRSVPFSDLWRFEDEPDEPALPADRFTSDTGSSPGHWISVPRSWDTLPEERLLSQETRAVIDKAIAELPASQRAVITMRDLEGIPSQEVCNILQISESNQRVLLHRARSRVRRALEQYFEIESTDR
jgi:RNA polymerase sigma-70 factor (ECF subfamily)